MIDLKRTDSEKNYILGRLIPEFYKKRSTITIKYKGKDYISSKLRRCDYQEMCMFLLGLYMECYKQTSKDEVFTKASKEVLKNLLKDIEC